MKITIEKEIRPFDIPTEVNTGDGETIAITALTPEALGELCDEFRKGIFASAAKRDPATGKTTGRIPKAKPDAIQAKPEPAKATEPTRADNAKPGVAEDTAAAAEDDIPEVANGPRDDEAAGELFQKAEDDDLKPTF